MDEGKRGPEPQCRELVAPLRQGERALGAAGGLLRRLDDETTLWPWVRALNELPACIGFHPFATTADWSVDLERRQAPATPAEPWQGWSPGLTGRARRRQRISVAGGAASTPASSAAQAAHAVKPDSAPAGSPSPGTRPPAQAAARPMPQTGAWNVLLAIVQVLEEIESAPGSRGSPSPTPARAALREPHRGNPRAADMGSETRAGEASGAAPAVGSTAAANPAGAAASHAEPATALLAQYVAALWSSAAAPAGSQARISRETSRDAAEPAAVPRTRAPSLLLPERSPGGTPPGHDSEAPGAGGSPRSAAFPANHPGAGDAPPAAWPANDPGEGDTLAGRLNRELLEQAWLRGVDLT